MYVAGIVVEMKFKLVMPSPHGVWKAAVHRAAGSALGQKLLGKVPQSTPTPATSAYIVNTLIVVAVAAALACRCVVQRQKNNTAPMHGAMFVAPPSAHGARARAGSFIDEASIQAQNIHGINDSARDASGSGVPKAGSGGRASPFADSGDGHELGSLARWLFDVDADTEYIKHLGKGSFGEVRSAPPPLQRIASWPWNAARACAAWNEHQWISSDAHPRLLMHLWILQVYLAKLRKIPVAIKQLFDGRKESRSAAALADLVKASAKCIHVPKTHAYAKHPA
jgi:hypothetical protein